MNNRGWHSSSESTTTLINYESHASNPRLGTSSVRIYGNEVYINALETSVNVGTGAVKLSRDVSISGSLNVGTSISGKAYIPTYVAWNTYGVGDGGAAIYNDNGVYDALMIAGNNSGGGNRVVRVYDELVVSNYVRSENSQGFTGRREGTQSIANAAWAAVSCTHDDIDNYSLFDGTNFVPSNTGFYAVSGKITWASNSSGNRHIGIYNATSGVYLYLNTLRGGATYEVHQSISAVLYLTSGHNIRLVCWQDSGAALDIGHASDGNYFARFGAHKLN